MFADQYQTPLVIGPMPEKLANRQFFGRADVEAAYLSRMTDIALNLLGNEYFGSITAWDMWVAECTRRELVALDAAEGITS